MPYMECLGLINSNYRLDDEPLIQCLTDNSPRWKDMTNHVFPVRGPQNMTQSSQDLLIYIYIYIPAT